MHLNADDLVELAEGARPESSAPHLAACPQCRAQLDELRAAMSALADLDVPEPSPLFWDHFSQRVHDAVAAEAMDARLKGSRSIVPGVGSIVPGMRVVVPRLRSFVLDIVGARAFQASVVALAAVAIFFLLPANLLSPTPPRPGGDDRQPPVAASALRDLWADAAADTDPSLVLVANLTATLDADGTSETGLARVGSAEHALTHMNDADLRALHRILQEEMAP
jgi:hypothetical protein